LNQTFDDFEFLVIDDGSTDGTVDAARRVAATDRRLRIIQQDNQGLAAVRNRGIEESRGELIVFLDNDDLWHPEKLALQVELLDSHPEVAVASCYSALIDEHYNCIGWRYGGNANGNVYDEMLEWDMVSGGSVAMVRRKAFSTVGLFDETLSIRSDWDMWIRLARHYPFATVPRVLVGYTRRELGMSRDYASMAEVGERLLDKVMREDPDFGKHRRRLCGARDLFGIACFCTVDGQVKPAWSYLGKSLAVSPLPVLRRPRRWAVVGLLMVQSVLPGPAYRAVLKVLNQASFQLPPGRPFRALDTDGHRR